jgi:hypothetical protein
MSDKVIQTDSRVYPEVVRVEHYNDAFARINSLKMTLEETGEIAEARIEAWRKTANLKQLEADENEKNYLAVLARIKELEARLRAADELADAVEQNFTKSEPQPGVYQYDFTGQWKSNPYEIAAAYREASK